MTSEETPQIGRRASLAVFAVVLVSFCLWVLQLPMFPMQDGPMHLYFAQIFGDLLANPNSPYANYYAIQHLLPPYSLHYYLLILLMKLLPVLWAEKVVICCVIVCFCCGVRYLAISNGNAGRIFSLFSFAIVLNWPLMMGFQNYVLSLAFACFATGVWIRSRVQDSDAMRALFVGLCALVAITHPVPLLLVLGFGGVDLLISVGVLLLSSLVTPKVGWLKDALALAAATTLLLYFRAFTDKARSVEDLHAPESIATRAHYFFGLHGLDFFARAGFASHVLQVALYAILFVCAGFALRMLLDRRKGEWKPAYTWLILTALFTLLLPFLPDDLSGSKALVSRLQVVTWIGLIAAASGAPQIGRRWTAAISLLAVAAAGVTLALGQARLAPISRRILAVDQLHLPLAGKAGLLLSAAADDAASFDAVTYEPLHWQAAAYFAKQAQRCSTPRGWIRPGCR